MQNPFSTHFWKPGSIPFLFVDETLPTASSATAWPAKQNTGQPPTLLSLSEQASNHSVCQIVGPHGSGKSTLLLALNNLYKKNGLSAQYLLFQDKPGTIPDAKTFANGHIILADGVEKLSLFNQMKLRLRAKHLILTTHRPIWFIPVLYRTKPDFGVFLQIVRNMLSDGSHSNRDNRAYPADLLEEPSLFALYTRAGGNFRTAFFELYDRVEEYHRGDAEKHLLPIQECTVLLSFGSNLGRRHENLRHAWNILGQTQGITTVRISPFYETAPVGGPPGQPMYINAAGIVQTTLPPGELLETLHRIEARFGRTRTIRWAERTLDIDILLYENHIIESPTLTIPHTEMLTRLFVLEPACDIAADWTHPQTGKTLKEHLFIHRVDVLLEPH